MNDHLAIIIITDTSEGLYITDCTDATFQYYLNTANRRLLVKLPQICFVLFVCFFWCVRNFAYDSFYTLWSRDLSDSVT